MQSLHNQSNRGGLGIAAIARTNNVGTRRRRARKIREWNSVAGSKGMFGSKAGEES